MSGKEEGLSPKVAFFIETLAIVPTEIKADKDRGGLTDFGVQSYGPELRKLIEPIVLRLKKDIEASAKTYIERRGKSEGTECLQLNDEERQEFFKVLEKDGLALSDFQQRIFSTSIIY